MQAVELQRARVPKIGFGTWRLTGDECYRSTRHALEHGYRHVDTARMYGNEREVGRAIADSGVDRDDVFVTTKLWRDELTADAVPRAVTDSLDALGTDHVDLLLVHWPNPDVPLTETLDAMAKARSDGRTLHIGLSNVTASMLREALDVTELVCMQVEHHPYLAQDALLEVCLEQDLALAAYCPVARGEIADDEVLTEIGRRYDKTPFQVALRWLVQRPNVCSLPRSADPDHIEENVDVFDFELTDDEMQRIAGLDRGRRLVDPGWAPDWD